MKTLEQIAHEVGKKTFDGMKEVAEFQFKGSPFANNGSEAHHAYVYAVIYHQYELHISKQKKERRYMQL